MAAREERILEQLIGQGIGTSGLAGRTIQQANLPTLGQALGTSQATRQAQQRQRLADVRGRALATLGQRRQEALKNIRRPVPIVNQKEQLLRKLIQEARILAQPAGVSAGGARNLGREQAGRSVAKLASALGINFPFATTLGRRAEAGGEEFILEEFRKGGFRGIGGFKRGGGSARGRQTTFPALRESRLRLGGGRGRQPTATQLQTRAEQGTLRELQQLLRLQVAGEPRPTIGAFGRGTRPVGTRLI